MYTISDLCVALCVSGYILRNVVASMHLSKQDVLIMGRRNEAPMNLAPSTRTMLKQSSKARARGKRIGFGWGGFKRARGARVFTSNNNNKLNGQQVGMEGKLVLWH